MQSEIIVYRVSTLSLSLVKERDSKHAFFQQWKKHAEAMPIKDAKNEMKWHI